jgi:hypothetical protein
VTPDECAICAQGYYNIGGICKKCIDGCSKCSNNYTCDYCFSGYQLKYDGQCELNNIFDFNVDLYIYYKEILYKKYHENEIHNKSAKDNILRKVNVYFLKFAVKLSNEVVEKFGFERNFIDLDHSIKKNITQKSLKGLKSLTFGELLCKNISKKYRKHSFNENEIFYKKVIENENIKKIFSEKYMTIFGIFLKSQRNIKIGHYDFDLSPKINMFDSFLSNIENKYKNDDSYIKKIKEVIQDY